MASQVNRIFNLRFQPYSRHIRYWDLRRSVACSLRVRIVSERREGAFLGKFAETIWKSSKKFRAPFAQKIGFVFRLSRFFVFTGSTFSSGLRRRRRRLDSNSIDLPAGNLNPGSFLAFSGSSVGFSAGSSAAPNETKLVFLLTLLSPTTEMSRDIAMAKKRPF